MLHIRNRFLAWQGLLAARFQSPGIIQISIYHFAGVSLRLGFQFHCLPIFLGNILPRFRLSPSVATITAYENEFVPLVPASEAPAPVLFGSLPDQAIIQNREARKVAPFNELPRAAVRALATALKPSAHL